MAETLCSHDLSNCIPYVLLTNCPKSKGFTLFVDLVFTWKERIKFFFYSFGQVFLPIEQKNLFIVSTISCLSTMLFPLPSVKLSILVIIERSSRSWLIVFHDSFMLPCCIQRNIAFECQVKIVDSVSNFFVGGHQNLWIAFHSGFVACPLCEFKPFKLALAHGKCLSETLICLRGACFSIMAEKMDDQWLTSTLMSSEWPSTVPNLC